MAKRWWRDPFGGIDWGLLGLIGIAFGMGLLLSVAVFVQFNAAQTARSCLARGYPQSKIDWTLKGYCIKRVDQSDVVTELRELEQP